MRDNLVHLLLSTNDKIICEWPVSTHNKSLTDCEGNWKLKLCVGIEMSFHLFRDKLRNKCDSQVIRCVIKGGN